MEEFWNGEKKLGIVYDAEKKFNDFCYDNFCNNTNINKNNNKKTSNNIKYMYIRQKALENWHGVGEGFKLAVTSVKEAINMVIISWRNS